MSVTHYVGSRGPVEIATMPYPHLVNAHAKLAREGDPSRSAEIEAMTKRIAELDAEHAELERERGDAPDEEPNPRVHLGANHPPEPTVEAAAPTGYDAIIIHITDLLTEARNWADGKAAENQAQADEISRLIDELRKAEKTADDARVVEKKPLDDQIAAIQERYNVYIAPLKNKKPGKIPVAVEALKAALKPYLDKLEEAKRAEAERLRKEAAAAAEKAAEAARAAATSADIEQREAAEDLVAAAADLQADAKRAEKDRAHAVGGSRAMGLRTVYRAVLTDRGQALRHYAATQPDELVALLQRLADQDVRRSIRSIPGFNVVAETVL